MLKQLQAEWKAMTTSQKICYVVDIICRVGAGFAGNRVGKALTKDAGTIETICVQTFTTGLGFAAGKAAGEAFEEALTFPAAKGEKTNA